jgi:hypothetical protein
VRECKPNETVVATHHLKDNVIADRLFRSEPPQVKRLLGRFAFTFNRHNVGETDRMMPRIVEP